MFSGTSISKSSCPNACLIILFTYSFAEYLPMSKYLAKNSGAADLKFCKYAVRFSLVTFCNASCTLTICCRCSGLIPTSSTSWRTPSSSCTVSPRICRIFSMIPTLLIRISRSKFQLNLPGSVANNCGVFVILIKFCK